MLYQRRVFPFCRALLHSSIINFSKINLLYKLYFQNESSATLFTIRINVNMYCSSMLYGLLILLPSLPVPSPTLTVTAQYKGELFIGTNSPSSGSHRLEHNESITYYFIFNLSEGPDRWLPTLFGNLLLSFEIRRRVLLGSKGIRSRAHWLSFTKIPTVLLIVVKH